MNVFKKIDFVLLENTNLISVIGNYVLVTIISHKFAD